MPDISGPFDGSPWLQAQWYRDAFARSGSGVYGVGGVAVGSGDLPLTVNGLTVSVGLGRAHVRGAGYERTATPWSEAVPATSGTLPRRDRLVLRRDLAAKTVTPLRLQGVPAAAPVSQPLTQVENGIWDEPLFSFTVPANGGTVLTAITDERRWLDPTGSRSAANPLVYSGIVVPGSRADVIGYTASTINIPDPGYPYRLLVSAAVAAGQNIADARIDLQIVVGPTIVSATTKSTQTANQTVSIDHPTRLFPASTSAPYTGAQTVSMRLARQGGTGTAAYAVADDAVINHLTVQVIPA